MSFFKHYRKGEHRDGTESRRLTYMKKGIYSLPALAKLLYAANQRYLQFISTIDDPSCGVNKLGKICKPVVDHTRSYKGFNLFDAEDQKLFENQSPTVSLTSAAFRTSTCDANYQAKPVLKFPVPSNACMCMA